MLWCEFHFWFSGGQISDLDNLITSGLDLLQKAGVISNDKWVRSFDGSRLHYKEGKEDYTIVTIREFDQDKMSKFVFIQPVEYECHACGRELPCKEDV